MIVHLVLIINMCERFLIHSHTIIDHMKNRISIFHESLYNKKSFAFFVLQAMIDCILNNRLKNQLDQWYI